MVSQREMNPWEKNGTAGTIILSSTAIGVDCSRSWVVSEHEALKVFEKVRALIQAAVCGVKPFVALWGDKGW